MSREIIRYKPVDEPVIPGSMMKPEKGLEPLGLFISTYGCQMNDNDSERMVSLLEFMNYTQVSSPEQASLIIINSCSVREKPVHKVQSEVGRYRKLKDKNPNLKIGVAGCVAQQEKDKLLKDLPLLDFVMGPDNIDSLPKIVSDLDKAGDEYNRINAAKFKHQEPYHVETLVRNAGVSTFVNITKGCDNFCTFCVVPYTRGRERSRPYAHLVDDINKLVKKGVKEVTLLGQNVNSYKCESGVNFANLLKGLYKDTDIKRIRYTTSHPKDFSDELIAAIINNNKLSKYIHLPLQSASNKILESMNRYYKVEDYLKIIEKLKKGYPDISISTDILLGFPGEGEKEYKETYNFVKDIRFDKSFVFMYSPREGTNAYSISETVSKIEKKNRVTEVVGLQNNITEKNLLRFIGKELEVISEGPSKKNKSQIIGMSEFENRVVFDGDKNDISTIQKIKINSIKGHTLIGSKLNK